ncbi:MAG: hypothetical protein P1V20_08630 [Verrucomicrobiales bacterium]|nr:hypothetical protein [Verrucomicrobiales bacterium]
MAINRAHVNQHVQSHQGIALPLVLPENINMLIIPITAGNPKQKIGFNLRHSLINKGRILND